MPEGLAEARKARTGTACKKKEGLAEARIARAFIACKSQKG